MPDRMMDRVNIKVEDSNDPRRKGKLLGILSHSKIFGTRTIPVSDRYIILTENDEELDTIFDNKTDTKFKEK